jgi:CMP-N-acetylneuraminic acid synthetase
VEPLREISIPAVPALSVSRADQLTLERFVGQNPELSNEWASLLQLIFRDSNSVPIDADELAKQRATAYNALISHIGTAFERYESQNPAEAAQVSRILLDIYKKLTASASV